MPAKRAPTLRSKSWATDERVQIKKDRGGGKEKDGKQPGNYHSLKMQQALATVSYGARNQIKNKISDVETFEDFPLSPLIQLAVQKDALKKLEEVVPTPIQKLAIPALLGTGESRRRRQGVAEERGMQQFLLAAETGSGKTMAYLLPAIDAMKRAEVEEKRIKEGIEARKQAEEQANPKDDMFVVPPPEDFVTSTVGKPKVIVLVPTAELVEQVGALAKALSHTVKFRAAFVSSNYSQAVIKSRLFSPMDILISTPHLLASISDSEANILSQVTHLVIDEADSLLDRSFSPTTSKIVDKSTPSLKQLVLCSATIPKRLDNYMRERFPDIKRLTTPNLHAIPRRVQLGVVDVEKDPYRGNKDLACADVIWKIGSSAFEHGGEGDERGEKVPIKRLIVFVNEREKSVELAEYLASKGVDALALNRDLDTRTQTDLLAQFCGTASSKDDNAKPAPARRGAKMPTRTLPHTKVLVCTDIASRGIDTTAVRHVVLYDVPHTSIDFIHRLGRTGRMGRRGRGVVLVGKNDRKDVVREIREAMFRGAALI
jgi:ATP-dependent RNA helicase MRH4